VSEVSGTKVIQYLVRYSTLGCENYW